MSSGPLFEGLENGRAEVAAIFGFNEEKDLEEAIDHLAEWARKQNHFMVKEYDRRYLFSYLITAKGSLEKAKKRLDKRMTLCSLMPEMFLDVDMKADFNDLHKCFQHGVIPLTTKDNYRVVIEKFQPDKVNHFDHARYARYCIKCAEYHILHDFVVGQIAILDMQDLDITTVITKLNPLIVQKFMTVLIEGIGAKLKTIHIISASKLVDTVVTILKTGLSEKMKNRFQIHKTPETLTQYIDIDRLPSDYGGSMPTIQELHEKYFKELSTPAFMDYIKIIDKYKTDETKRLKTDFNDEYLGMPGSFRTLSVD